MIKYYSINITNLNIQPVCYGMYWRTVIILRLPIERTLLEVMLL